MPGTALGTVTYKSPEQARGEDIDARTDLISLGTVLYEMETGRQAIGGSTTAVVYEAIHNRAPRAVAHLNPDVPSRLETVIATALEKDRDLRYQHASDLQAELKRLRRDMDSMSVVGSQPAVLPSRESVTVPDRTAAAAEKYYRTVCEEHAAGRPAFRSRQLVALARVTASEHGFEAPGLAAARERLGA
jgi:serine/threonine protein kinase